MLRRHALPAAAVPSPERAPMRETRSGGSMRRGGTQPFLSWGALVVTLLASAFALVQHGAAPPSGVAACAGPLPFTLVLPATLPSAAATPAHDIATPAAGESNTAVATAIPAASGTVTPTATSTPEPVATLPPIASLLRADDPPADHGLVLAATGPLPLLTPRPCALSTEQRHGAEPCVALLPPAGTLCAAGVVAAGSLAAGDAAPVLALQAARITLTDAAGATLLDTLQGYLRYDDPARGLRLFCPEIRLMQDVGPNARQIVALCRNGAQEGWAVSGQVTDGAAAAPDSVGLTIAAPDGSQQPLSGTLATGAAQVRGPRATPEP
jgi:hypothetical protein